MSKTKDELLRGSIAYVINCLAIEGMPFTKYDVTYILRNHIFKDTNFRVKHFEVRTILTTIQRNVESSTETLATSIEELGLNFFSNFVGNDDLDDYDWTVQQVAPAVSADVFESTVNFSSSSQYHKDMYTNLETDHPALAKLLIYSRLDLVKVANDIFGKPLNSLSTQQGTYLSSSRVTNPAPKPVGSVVGTASGPVVVAPTPVAKQAPSTVVKKTSGGNNQVHKTDKRGRLCLRAADLKHLGVAPGDEVVIHHTSKNNKMVVTTTAWRHDVLGNLKSDCYNNVRIGQNMFKKCGWTPDMEYRVRVENDHITITPK